METAKKVIIISLATITFSYAAAAVTGIVCGVIGEIEEHKKEAKENKKETKKNKKTK